MTAPAASILEGEEKLKHYKMKVLLFGAKCSPTIAQYIKNLVAENIKNKLPECAEIMLKSTYVDDIVTSIKEKDEFPARLFELKLNFKNGGFNMLKIKTNNIVTTENTKSLFLKSELREDKQFNDDNPVKILGYMIDFEKDELCVHPELGKVPELIKNGKALPTKRQLLQFFMSFFYDPLGYF